jgi:hypothetical protein
MACWSDGKNPLLQYANAPLLPVVSGNVIAFFQNPKRLLIISVTRGFSYHQCFKDGKPQIDVKITAAIADR